jgi:type IV pilus assembly protein PilY1
MSTITNDKIRLIWLLALFASSLSWPVIPAWATGFTPVTQCFRDTGAPGWIMQEYSSGVKNTTVPLTAATGIDAAGSGWLRLTDNTNNQSGNAYYTLPINVTQLGIQAQFSYTAWGGTGADGISLYLFDGATTPANFVQGVFGGGLGYCQQNNYGGSSSSTSPTKTYVYGTPSTNKFELKNWTGGTSLPGLSNAVVGVGIDDYGNFANNNDRCSNFGENGQTNHGGVGNSYGTIAVRGPGNGQNGYNWLADTNNTTTPNNTPTWYTTSASTRPTVSQFYRNVLVNISPATVGSASSYTVKTSWQTAQNGVYTQLLTASYPGIAFPITGTTSANVATSPYLTKNPPANSIAPYNSTGIFKGDFFQLPATTGDVWNPLPPTIKFGFGASTGGSTNYHEIQDAYFTEGLPDLAITQNDPSASGGMGTFQVTVTNLGSTIATNATFTATFSGLSNMLWSCIPSAGSSCPATNGSVAPTNVNFSLGIVGNVTFIFKGRAAAGSAISDTVSIAGASGFNDADTTSNTSTASMTIGSSPTHLNLSQLPQTSDSAANNTVTGGQVQTSTQVYVAQYHPANWWGGLAAYNLVSSGTGMAARITGLASLANWDAGCKLTGGSCTTTGTTYSVPTSSSPSNRAILTWNNTTGIPFAWTNLNSAQVTALSTDPAIASSSYKCGTTGTTTCTGSDVVDYLIGGRSNEQGDSTPGPFRTRTGILGDIIDSNPVFVGKPAANYPTTAPWSDLLYPTQTMPENAGTNSYGAYQTAQATRMNIAYIASNDGMVHGFRSGKYDSTGTVYDATTNDGLELLAYMPGVVLTSIAQNNATAFATNYNFTDPAYTHHFFVNASPGTGDLYYTNAWHTWLVGGLGGGGQAIYALDITGPTTFSQSNAANLVVKELNMANMTCNNVPACANDLGWTYGTPIIRRMHNGTWAVIFGNGYNSTNSNAAVFVATINSSTGAWSVYELQTNGQLPNGINYVSSADLDGDNVTDYLYAGDLFGNVWRFDVTSSNPATWGASKFGGSSAQPLFTATNASGIAQPITTAVQIQTTQQNGLAREIIMFGTGKNLEASDLLPDNTTHGVQSIYGVWDWDMTTWNANSSKHFALLTAPQTITRSNLQQQTVTGTYDGSGNTFSSSSTSGYRTLSGTTVCWQGLTTCYSSNNAFGFYLDLPSLGEEVLYNPIIVNKLFTVNTTIPSAQTKGMTCYPPTPPGGWTMAINPLNGGVVPTGGSVFSDNSGNFSNINNSPVSGMFVNAVGTPSVITYNNLTYLLNKTSSGSVVVQQFQSIPIGKRLNWIELR